MWCRPDARLRHYYCCWLTRDIKLWDISPLCDVAQTSDYGTLVIYFWYKPFMWCRSDVRLWHALSFIFYYRPFMRCRLDARLRHCYFIFLPFRGVIQTLDCPSVLLWDFGRTTARLPFYTSVHCYPIDWVHMLTCSYASCLLLLYLIFELSCGYFHSTLLPCWFGQMLRRRSLGWRVW